MEEREVKDFHFRQLRKVSIGDPAVAPELRYSLLCTSNEFGLTFVGCGGGVYVFETSVLYDVDQDETIGPRNAIADASSLKATLIPTHVPPLHVSLSCDSLTLCVALRENSIIKCFFYDTRAISLKGAPITPFATIDLSTQQDVQLLCLQWNPAVPDILAVSLSDRLCLLQVKEDVGVVETKSLCANAICWSPKGKQLAVGLRDGGILQLSSKNLEQKKSFPCPDAFGGNPQQVSDLYWVSTYMFAVVYTPQSPTDNMPSFVFLSAPKGKSPDFINCDDVYYGTGTSKAKFYFTFIGKWGVLVSSSANAVDTAVFAQHNDGWEKWELEDTGRIEMPLDQDNEETFAAGMALDLTSQQEVVINTNITLPPAPLLLVYSDQGVLCPYFIVNTGCPPSDFKELISPPHPLPSGPVRQPTSIQAKSRPLQKSPLESQPQPQLQSLLSGGSQPFTLVYSQTLQASTSSILSQNVGSQPSITTSGTSKLGPSPLTMGGSTLGGSTLGGSKLGSTTGTQPSFSQFSVSALTSGQPLGSPLLPFSTAPRPLQGPQLQTSLGMTTPAPFLLGTRAPLPRSSGPPQSAAAGSLASTLPVTSIQASKLTLPSYTASTTLPSYTASTTLPSYTASTSAPKSLSVVQPPTSQPPPNVSLPKTMQLPPAVNMLNQSFQLEKLQMAPLYSSTPVVSMQMASKPPAQTSGGPLPMVTTKTTSDVHPQHQGQPKPLTLSGMPPPTQPGATRSSLSQPGAARLPPPAAVPPLSQPGATRLPPPTMVPPLSQPAAARFSLTQLGGTRLPPHAMVPPPTQSGAAMPSPSSLVPQLTQLGATRSPPTQPWTAMPPPTSLVRQLTQPEATRLPPPAYQSAAPPASASKQLSLKPPPKLNAQDDAESVDASANVELIDASFSQSIQEEIEGFAEELDSLSDEFRNVLGEWEGLAREKVEVVGLGTMEDLQQLREETQEMENAVQETTRRMKEIERSCEQLGDDTLRGYELSEESKANLKKKNDANYISLLKLRPLDAYNARWLNDIRSSFLQIEQSVGEVNSQLDAEMERRYEDRRQKGRTPMKSPSVQTIYYSLRTNRKIARMQDANIERLTHKMKQLKLIPQSWHPPDVVPATSPTAGGKSHIIGTPPSAERLPRGELESPTWKTISADKLETLRDYLSNIEHVPVRRVKTTRFTFSSRRGDHFGISASQEASLRSGTATPYSTTEDQASVADSERASMVYEHVPTSLHSSKGLQALILQPSTSSLRSLQSDSSIHVILTNKQDIMVSTSQGYKLTASPSRTQQAPPTVVQSDTSVNVNVLRDQSIEVAAIDGYSLTTSPSRTQQAPPTMVQGGTVHWGGSPPTQPVADHSHTVTPPTRTAPAPNSQLPSLSISPPTFLPSLQLGSTSTVPTLKTQQPSLSLAPATFLSSLQLGSTGTAPTPKTQQPSLSLAPTTLPPSLSLDSESSLRRAVPLSNLTRIQASSSDHAPTVGASVPLAPTQSVAATKSELSKLLFSTPTTTSSSLTTTSITQPSSAFSFNVGTMKPLTLGNNPLLSANPALTIKPGGVGPAGLSGLLFSATPSVVQQKAPATTESQPSPKPGLTPTTTVVSTAATSSSVFANLPTFSAMTMTNFGSLGGSSSSSPFQFGLKTQPPGATADTLTEKNAPKLGPFGTFKTDSKPPSTTKVDSTTSGNFMASLLTQSLPASTKTESSSTITTSAGSAGFVFGAPTSSFKLSSLSSAPFKPPGAPQLPASGVAHGEEEDGESKDGESEAESTGTTSTPGSDNPPEFNELDSQALGGDRQLGPFTLRKMSSEGDPVGNGSLVSKPPSSTGEEPLSLVAPPLSMGENVRGEEGAGLEEGEVAEDQESATADPAVEQKEQTEPKVTLQPTVEQTVEQTVQQTDQINMPPSHPVGSRSAETDNEPPGHGDEKSTDVVTPVRVQPPTLPPSSVAKESPPLSVTSLAATIPTHTPGSSTASAVSVPATQVQEVPISTAGEKATEIVVKRAESEDVPSDSQTQTQETSVTMKKGVELKSSHLSMPASQSQVSGGVETKQQQNHQQQQQQQQQQPQQQQTGGALSQLVEQFAGSQESLQSAAGEEQEQEMEEMTGVLDNDMEPLDSTSVGNEQQQSHGGLFGLSFGGLGGKASNPSANPFGTPLPPSSAVPTTTSTLLNRPEGGGSSIIRPASGSFGLGAGVGAGTSSGTSSQFGASPGMGGTTVQGPSFGGGPTFGSVPTFGSGLGQTTFGSPPLLGTRVPTEGLGGRLFGMGGSSTGSGGLFQQSETASELSFGSLAQQPSQGFGAGGGSGFGGNIPVTEQSQFKTWR